MEHGHHIIALDLGFAGEPTALAVVKPRTEYYFDTPREDSLAHRNHFEVVHLERFGAGTGYPEIVARTKEIASDRSRILNYTLLANTATSGPAPLTLFTERNLHPDVFVVLNGSWSARKQPVGSVSAWGAVTPASSPSTSPSSSESQSRASIMPSPSVSPTPSAPSRRPSSSLSASLESVPAAISSA